MPFVHWLPKGFLRKLLIRLFLLLNVSPKWEMNSGKNALGTYHTYIDTKTYYRSLKEWNSLFSYYGFEMELITGKNRTFIKMTNIFPLNLIPVRLLEMLVSNLWIVHLHLVKKNNCV